MSKQDLKGKEEFQDVILEIVKYTAYQGIDNLGKFPIAVEMVRDLMEIYADDNFNRAISGSKSEEAIKKMQGPDKAYKLAKHKFRELIKLFGRSGFVPAKRIEGVLDGNVLDRIAEFSTDKSD